MIVPSVRFEMSEKANNIKRIAASVRGSIHDLLFIRARYPAIEASGETQAGERPE